MPEELTCIRCGVGKPLDLGGLCTSCVASTRQEVNVGLRRLGEYLAAWAAFDAWLTARGPGRGASAA